MTQDTPGSTPPLQPEDNPAVGTVTPDDYPDGRKNAELSPKRDPETEFERLNPGSGPDPVPE